MDYIQHIRKTELARNTSQIIRRVQRGQTVLVENHGQAEAAILDILGIPFYVRLLPFTAIL